MVSDITPNFKQGTLDISSNPMDMAIQGDGFFIVAGAQGEKALHAQRDVQIQFRQRAGDDHRQPIADSGSTTSSIQRTTLEPIEIPLGAAAVAQPTGNVF